MDKLAGITIGIGVTDGAKAVNWYRNLLGSYDILEPIPGLFELKLTDSTWLQFDDTGYLDQGGNSTIIRFETKDIEAAYTRTKPLASEIEDIVQVEGLLNYFDFKDPDQNRLSFVQLLE